MLRVLPTILIVALTVYAAVDCVQTDEGQIRNLPKLVWVFLILLFPIAGPATWFIAGRPVTSASRWPGRRPQGPPRGPDDDPDFLRKL
jgi:Phospholipase_D-nuclease N-terminal